MVFLNSTYIGSPSHHTIPIRTHFDYFLWHFLKDTVHTTGLHTIEEMQKRNRCISGGTPNCKYVKFLTPEVYDANSAHIEKIFYVTVMQKKSLIYGTVNVTVSFGW